MRAPWEHAERGGEAPTPPRLPTSALRGTPESPTPTGASAGNSAAAPRSQRRGRRGPRRRCRRANRRCPQGPPEPAPGPAGSSRALPGAAARSSPAQARTPGSGPCATAGARARAERPYRSAVSARETGGAGAAVLSPGGVHLLTVRRNALRPCSTAMRYRRGGRGRVRGRAGGRDAGRRRQRGSEQTRARRRAARSQGQGGGAEGGGYPVTEAPGE